MIVYKNEHAEKETEVLFDGTPDEFFNEIGRFFAEYFVGYKGKEWPPDLEDDMYLKVQGDYSYLALQSEYVRRKIGNNEK